MSQNAHPPGYRGGADLERCLPFLDGLLGVVDLDDFRCWRAAADVLEKALDRFVVALGLSFNLYKQYIHHRFSQTRHKPKFLSQYRGA